MSFKMSSDRLKVLHRHLTAPHWKATSAQLGPVRRFRYTVDSPVLTDSQRQFYEDNGYLVIRHLIDDDLLDLCHERFVDLCEGRVDKGVITMMKEMTLAQKGATGERLYYKAQDILYDDVFEQYILNEKLLDIVSAFVGSNIKAMHSMLINKPPDSGKLTSIHPLHQDLYYFPFRPADKIVAAWTAIEKVTEENGCLVVIPGSHRKEILLKHDYPKGDVNKAFHGIVDYPNPQTVPLPMEKGDTVFFHPLLIHGSGINYTNGFRKAITCHFAASDCYYIDVKGTVQEKIAREVEEMAAKRGTNISFNEAWQYRSRMARGEENSL